MENDKQKNKIYSLLMILGALCVCITYGGGKNSFYAMMLYSISYDIIVISVMFMVIYNAINIFKSINNNYEILCRFKNLKDYYKTIVKAVLKENFYIICKYLGIIAVFSAFACTFNFTIPSIGFYNIPFLIYLIYYLVKFIVIISLIGIITIPIYSMAKNLGITFYLFILVIASLNNVYYENFVIDSISKFPINFISYLSAEQYSFFLLDVIAFCLYVSIIILINRLLLEIVMKKRKDII